jgi:hypothetical protein
MSHLPKLNGKRKVKLHYPPESLNEKTHPGKAQDWLLIAYRERFDF